MASDDAYAAFLAKANEDPSAGYAQPAKKDASASASTRNAPPALVAAVRDTYYTSESDEPFAAVALPFQGTSLPDEDTFATLAAGADPIAAVTIMDPFEWDREGRYTDLLDAVREAGHGNDVRVYRVQLKNATRIEYWLVTVDGGDNGDAAAANGSADAHLVGVKALAIES